MQVEQQYAHRMDSLAKLEQSSSGDSPAHTLVGAYKQKMEQVASSHLLLVDVFEKLLIPIGLFLQESKLQVTVKNEIVANWKLLREKLVHVEKLQLEYNQISRACKVEMEAFKASPQSAMPALEVLVTLAEQETTIDEFNILLTLLQQKVATRSISTILGVYKECQSSTDLIAMFVELGHSEDYAKLAIAELTAQKYLKSVPAVGYGVPYFVWIKRWYSLSNEPKHAVLRKSRDFSEFQARKYAAEYDLERMELQVLISQYLNQAETLVLNHSNVARDTISCCANIESSVADSVLDMQQHLEVYFENVDANKELASIAERDRTGYKPLPSFKFCHFSEGFSNIFGVPLPNHEEGEEVKAAPFLVQLVSRLSASQQPNTIQYWFLNTNYRLKPLDIAKICETRKSIDSGTLIKNIPNLDMESLVMIAKIYLLELPNSLCSDDMYEPIKVLYMSKTGDESMLRLDSLKALLASLSTCHFNSLSFMVQYWASLIEGVEHQIMEHFAAILAPLILRPQAESTVTVHENHPFRLAKV